MRFKVSLWIRNLVNFKECATESTKRTNSKNLLFSKQLLTSTVIRGTKKTNLSKTSISKKQQLVKPCTVAEATVENAHPANYHMIMVKLTVKEQFYMETITLSS